MRIKLLFFLFLLIPYWAVSQEYTTKSKKAIKCFQQALLFYEKQDIDKALQEADKAINADKNFIEPYALKAEIYTDARNPEKTLKALDAILKINPEHNPLVYYRKAACELGMGKYTEAIKSYQKFQSYPNYPKHQKSVKFGLDCANFSLNAIKNPVPFQPINLGANINTQYDEYWPSLTIDNKTLIFTRLIPFNVQNPENMQEDFYISFSRDSLWTKAENMGSPVNTMYNEGAQSISANGDVMVFTACDRPDGQSCDIYISYREDGAWTRPKNIGLPVNTRFWESQPSLSADGHTLYFVSNRPGGKGAKDIWKSQMNEDETWSSPINLGDSINTEKDESAPFIHPDGQTLYFSSNGHVGLGEGDIFISRLNKDGKWGKALNLGYPINTFRDEMGLTVNTKGELAFIASNREGGFGGLDLYQFDLDPTYRPQELSYIQGRVYDAVSKRPLSATIQLMDIETNTSKAETFSDPYNGKFLLTMSLNENFGLFVEKEGYLFFSENFSLKDLKKGNNPLKAYQLNIPLQPIQVGSKIVLKNVFFNTDSYVLDSKSFIELDKLVKFLKLNAKMKVEIGGHTDNIGSEEHNRLLSDNRAKTVYNYLINKGIDKQRLTYKGYGFSQAIATNDTEAGRALNRRTEFKVIE